MKTIRLFIAAALALVAPTVFAAPALITGTDGQWESANANTVVAGITVDTGNEGAHRAFVIAVVWEQLTDTLAAPTLTLDEESLAKIGESIAPTDASGTRESIAFYRLLDPPTGQNELVITFNEDPQDAAALWATFEDVDQSTPVGAVTEGLTGTSDPTSTDITDTITTESAGSLIISASVLNRGVRGPLESSADDTEIQSQQLDPDETGNPSRGFSSILVMQSAPTAGEYDTGFTAPNAENNADNWNILAFELLAAAGADETPPTIESASINTSGDELTIVFSESVTAGTDGWDGFDLDGISGESLTYDSGDGTDTVVLGISDVVVLQTDVVTLGFTPPEDGVQDAAGNLLAAFSGQAVANGSAQLPAAPVIVSVGKIQAGKNLTITGAAFGSTQGDVVLSPADDIDDLAAESQSIDSWSASEIVTDGLTLPAGLGPGDPVYVFVTDDNEMDSDGFAGEVADPVLRLDYQPLRDTDDGELIDIASAELIALCGSAGARSIAVQDDDFAVVDGVVEVEDEAFSIDELTDTCWVGLIESTSRAGFFPATVVDRNED